METKQAEFIDLLLKVARRLRVDFDARIKAGGLTLARTRTLIALKKSDGLYQKALAEELGIENATLVRLLDALEAQKLISRDVVAADRRARNVALTAAGLAIVDEIEHLSIEIRAEVLNGISTNELTHAILLLSKMNNTIAARGTVEGNHE